MRWLKNLRIAGKHKSPYSTSDVTSAINTLEYLVAHGSSARHLVAVESTGFDLPPTNPPGRPWEAYVPDELNVYGVVKLCEWEVAGINNRSWHSDLVDAAFNAVRQSQLIHLHIHMLFPTRFPGEVLRRMHGGALVFTALGLVNGRDDDALARLQLAALRRKYYQWATTRPMACFTARILADYLGLEPMALKSDPPHPQEVLVPADRLIDTLLRVWRDPDADALTPHLLAICDLHTHHAYTGANSHLREFSNAMWTRVPIAALLVFKLRAMLGLASPTVDHPLMDSVLGTLPGSTKPVPDPLLERARARMGQDGFNEIEIADYYARQS